MAGGGGFFRYVKKAFLQHWNILAIAAGTALGFISGQPDVVLPLVAAGEVLYLAGLSTHPRFQKAVDAADHKRVRRAQSAKSTEKLQAILASLSDQDRIRYDKLRGLCLHLRKIALGVGGDTTEEEGLIDDLHMSSINRLLWIYLKLLYSKNALEQFFATIDEGEIRRSIDKAKKRLEAMGPAKEGEKPGKAKRRKSLSDTLATSEARMQNYQRAQDNHEFIELELDRLYSKIASLGEMGVNRQDSTYISSEVDSVTATVEQTEKAMGELEFLTGLEAQDDSPPELLEEDSTTQTE